MSDFTTRYDQAVRQYPLKSLQNGLDYIERPGEGPTLVMLHATFGTPHVYFPLFENLPDSYNLIGFALPQQLEPEDFRSRFEASCRELGIAHCVLLGAGIGGYLAQFIADLPMITGVILCCTMASFTHIGVMPDSRIDVLAAYDQQTIFNEVYQPMVADWPRGTPALMAVNELMLRRIVASFPAASFMECARFISHHRKAPVMPVPQSSVLIISTTDDPVSLPAARQELNARYPQARHLEFHDAGQFPFLTHEVAFAEAVDACLA